MVRIQFDYEILTGSITELSISALNTQDINNAKNTLSKINEGDLIIRDLSYISNEVLNQIQTNQKAYFLNRLKTNIGVYEKKENSFSKINFERIYKENKNMTIDKTVYLGKEKFRVRLILQKVPEYVYEQRLRKACKSNKKKANEFSKEYKSRLHFTIFITNIPDEHLSINQVFACYKIRWQIELVFKNWKSIRKIDEVKKVKQHRFECHLFISLLYFIRCS